ncbi:MAG TPA: hypothetical protein VG248_13205 [Caulobacteraceae bacterium]|jgi:predicted methyltransferase|nr:hypothetical protein [Caulobacteraceae bacterium]
MQMRSLTGFAAALVLAAGLATAPAAIGQDYRGAVADSHRPASDTARDADRKPAEMLAFGRIRRGEKVLEVIPGGGYFTRLFSNAVGPSGHVFAATSASRAKPVQDIAADAAYGNVTVVGLDAAGLSQVPPVDLVFTAQNFHDLYLTQLKLDVPAMVKSWYAKLKPGGELVVVDHAAAPGAPVGETANTLHRIDPAAVRREVEAAGFVFDGQTDVLRNPKDDHTLKVFDPAIRGHTDQFVMRFRKP